MSVAALAGDDDRWKEKKNVTHSIVAPVKYFVFSLLAGPAANPFASILLAENALHFPFLIFERGFGLARSPFWTIRRAVVCAAADNMA